MIVVLKDLHVVNIGISLLHNDFFINMKKVMTSIIFFLFLIRNKIFIDYSKFLIG